MPSDITTPEHLWLQQYELLKELFYSYTLQAPWALNPRGQPGELPDNVGTAIKHRHYVKLTFYEVLPRETSLKKGDRDKMRNHWFGLIGAAMKGIELPYEKVWCVIRLRFGCPAWDTDNRAHKAIIDALRYWALIKQDTAQNLTFTVTGGPVIDRPCTEVFLVDHPKDDDWFLQYSAAAHL